MPWVKLDDKFPDHPKVVAAGPMAGWLYICGLAYANRMLTDGFIPTAQVRRLVDIRGTQALADRLVEVGLWHQMEGGYQIHDYLEYQPSKDAAEDISRARAEAGRKGGKQKASKLLERGLTDASSKPLAKSKPVPVPVPHIRKEEEEVSVDKPPDALLELCLTEVPPSESTREDYRRTIDRYRPKLTDEHIERIIVQLADWKPTKPRRALHLTLAQWLSKEPRDPIPPSHAPADLPSLEGCVPMPEELKQVFALPIGRAIP